MIGQTSTSHKGMRLGVTARVVKDTLQNPVRVSKDYVARNGDVRRTYTGLVAQVAVSVTDGKLIQVNPRSDK